MSVRTAKASPRSRRGRPSKFGRPSQLVALTLPNETVRGLRRVHRDLGWAIVTLFEKQPLRTNGHPRSDVELLGIADGRFLIAVNPSIVKRLPGVEIIPLTDNRAFLALEPGRGMADLEIAVRDRLDSQSIGAAERRALEALRARLVQWRRDPSLNARSRAIIVVEQHSGKER